LRFDLLFGLPFGLELLVLGFFFFGLLFFFRAFFAGLVVVFGGAVRAGVREGAAGRSGGGVAVSLESPPADEFESCGAQ